MEQNFVKSRDNLNAIPQDTEERVEFYQTYDALLTALENEDGSGKTVAALQKLEKKAGISDPKARKGEISALAESALALLEGKSIVRSAIKTAKTGDLLNDSALNILSFYPNPANSTVVLQTEEEGTLLLYNLQGKLVQEFELKNDNSITITNLSDGVYVGHWLSKDGQISKTGKLVISH